jgi:MtN3 and saliva related transmembrane protein
MNVELVGFIAGLFVASSLFPQVLKSWETKSTKDISIAWNVINLIGQLIWLLYGILIGSISLIVMTTLTFLMVLSLLILKIKYG